MYRYFIRLAYDGTNYKGWQIQPNGVTVQELIMKAMTTILRYEISIMGAGRTDTGVHARNFIAHFDVENELSYDDLSQLTYKMNRFLPNDITIYEIFSVASDMHARFSAVSRTYKYYISQNRDPFMHNYAWYRFGNLDVESMNNAAAELLKVIDFTSFSKLHTITKTNNCQVTQAIWEQTDSGLVFTITADRFLRNMVRAIVGTLVEVGLGKVSHQEFIDIIYSKDRCAAGESVPACGLFLEEIKY
ncbi:MAG: tRNA pseudouridine(38-40) synthase TruA [Bacteroidota bacterium]